MSTSSVRAIVTTMPTPIPNIEIDNSQFRLWRIARKERTVCRAIELRRKLFEQTNRYQFIPKSILDFTWIDENDRSGDRSLLTTLRDRSMAIALNGLIAWIAVLPYKPWA